MKQVELNPEELKAIEVILKCQIEHIEDQLIKKVRYGSIDREAKQKAINFIANLVEKVQAIIYLDET